MLDRFSLPIICIVAGFGLGWAVNGFRLTARLSDLRAEHASVLAAALEQAAKKAAETQSAIQSIADTKLREMTDEIDRIRNHPAQRVYVRAHCPAASVPATSDSPGMDSGTGAELDPAYRGTLSDLRIGAVRTEAKLAACQQSLSEAVKAR